MPSYAKSTPEILRRRLQELKEELEASAPALCAEIRLVESLLKASEQTENKTYASTQSPWEAIELCLSLNPFKFTQPEAVSEILAGGYLSARPKAARGLLNDSVNYHIKKDRIIVKNGLLGLKSSHRSASR